MRWWHPITGRLSWRPVIGAILLACTGIILITLGLRPQLPDAAPVPAPFSVAAATRLPSELPANPGVNRLYIPSLGVDAPLVSVGVKGGKLQVPPVHQVGRYRGTSSADGSAGSTIIAGHVSWNGVKGALHQLADITPHATVITTDDVGTPTYWSVTGLTSLAKTDLSVDAQGADTPFPSTGPPRLVLVTCGGVLDFDGTHYTYSDNVLATASPITPPPAQ